MDNLIAEYLIDEHDKCDYDSSSDSDNSEVDMD